MSFFSSPIHSSAQVLTSALLSAPLHRQSASNHYMFCTNKPHQKSPSSNFKLQNQENQKIKQSNLHISIMPRKAASASTSDLTPKSWDNVDFLNDLLVAFYQVGCHTNSFNPQVNNAIVEFLTSRGYDTSWSAIR
ncbi:hypothetical protein LI328DRAFT_160588 [Trichoderma asperelloides]|nr:hypothetical protein LI328DRAFT_160588 [Trichoderma asperelloides]